MDVALVALAEAANVTPTGTLNIKGIYDSITVKRMPLVIPSLTFVIRLRCEHEDRGRKHQVEFTVIDQDGHSRWAAEANLRTPDVKPGRFSHFTHIQKLRNVKFQQFGRYRLRVQLEDREEPHDAVFRIVQQKGE